MQFSTTTVVIIIVVVLAIILGNITALLRSNKPFKFPDNFEIKASYDDAEENSDKDFNSLSKEEAEALNQKQNKDK